METELRIGRLEQSMIQESLELSQFAFQYVMEPEAVESFTTQFQEEPADRWAVYDGERIAAKATVLELEFYVGGQVFKAGGVAGVATWPEYRRQGLVARLLEHSLQEMKAKGQVLSMLHPFAVGFYRKFGWELYTDKKKYTLTAAQLPPRTLFSGKIERRSSRDSLHGLYHAVASRYNGSLVRTPLWWKYHVPGGNESQVAVYVDEKGSDQGYLLYTVKDMELVVHELMALDHHAEKAIWSFIGQHDSMIKQARISMPIDDTLPDMLPDPRILQEIHPYFMARIVDVDAFLQQYPFRGGTEHDTFKLHITDKHAPWNEGMYELAISPEGKALLKKQNLAAAATPVSFEGAEGDSAISLDIGSLTMLLLGYRKGTQLSASGRIQGSREMINRLQSRIPERTTWLPDFF
ncbi:GNAT family N-acetyltransferase [Paenibacillus sp. CAU 1782]